MQRNRRTMIMTASVGVIGLVCLCLTSIGGVGGYMWSQGMWPFVTPATDVVIRVSDRANGTAIPRAGVVAFAQGERYVENTDSRGTASLAVKSITGLSLVVEADGYQIEELNRFSLDRDGVLNVALSKHRGDQANVIVLVTDERLDAVSGAEVVLLAEGDTFTQPTDSNGIAKFPMQFQGGKIEAVMRVNTDAYEIDSQNVTLLPNKVQGIKLNAREQTLAQVEVEPSVPSAADVAPRPTFALATNNNSSIQISPVAESEPNNTAEAAQMLAVGMSRPVNASLTAAPSEDESADEDWYRFTAKAGEEYLIEIFDVANTLALVSHRYNCGEGTTTYSGLRLIISDPSLNEVSRQCAPIGAGNIHTLKQFTAGVDGDYYLQVVSHSPVVEGGYSLRILPKYGQENANWDSITFEPNNRNINAYPILPGWEGALQSTIEPRSDTYSTNRPDRDSYRFEAIAGQSYVVELFDVSNSLSLKTNRYNCGEGTTNYTGLWLGVFDPIENEVIRQCAPTGAGDVHSIVEFTAGNDGTFHVVVFPHEQTVAGSYTIRVLPKHEEPGAGWDTASHEPNNKAANAYPLQIGEANALFSEIEPRNGSYSTNRSDRDWYYFTAEAGQTYRVELFEVDSRLELASARYNCGEGTTNYTGLWLGAYDTSVNEITRQCTPNGEGNVHSFIEFTASRSEIHYLRVFPHEGTLSGDYNIRIIAK